MGHTHALSGAAAWLAVTSSSPLALDMATMPASAVCAGAVVTAGAALLPDADHHSGTIAHSLPPLTTFATQGVEQISGGHRHGTHSIIGIAAATGLAWLLTPIRWTATLPQVGKSDPWFTILGWDAHLPWFPGGTWQVQIGAWAISLLLVAFAAKSLRITRGWFTAWLVAILAASLAVLYAPHQLWWLPLSVAIGCTVHLLGDLITVQGVNPFWPLKIKAPTKINLLQRLLVILPGWVCAASAWWWSASLDEPNQVAFFVAFALTVAAGAFTVYAFAGGFEKGTIWRENGYFSIPLLGTAGSRREGWFVYPLAIYIVLVLVETLVPGASTWVWDRLYEFWALMRAGMMA